ncbi:solute carrier family 25 member 47-B isoform X1 [Lepisosteus oculatus]|uniref:solute carrier family 25 member 47-B isoform X1 n=1 Tax=Lepisosteus oculatus TaxID=7918 RepID=UPI00073FC63B|nr:PREDICTED: solute carrier family 25 member 47 isoform X1 [Lepisosteus oculatus]
MHVVDFLAGSVGEINNIGALGVVVGYPLDTVKVRIQTERKLLGAWQCIHTIAKKEGVNGFFKGLTMPLITVSISSSVTFGTYRNCLQCLRQVRCGSLEAPTSKSDIFLAGLVAGVAQVSVMSPADIVKVRLQCQTEPYRPVQGSGLLSKPKYHSPVHCLLTIAREEGMLGLYKGATALCLRDGPSFATYFLTYSVFCDWLTPAGKNQPEWWAVLVAGGCAGMCGWSIGTPMDVIKSRLQVDGVRKKRYNGIVHCISESIQKEGLTVLFKGLGLNCLRAFPVNMVVFATYEMVIQLLHKSL